MQHCPVKHNPRLIRVETYIWLYRLNANEMVRRCRCGFGQRGKTKRRSFHKTPSNGALNNELQKPNVNSATILSGVCASLRLASFALTPSISLVLCQSRVNAISERDFQYIEQWKHGLRQQHVVRVDGSRSCYAATTSGPIAAYHGRGEVFFKVCPVHRTPILIIVH